MRRQFRVTPSEITETVPWIETKEKSEARRPYRIGKRSDAEFLVITFTVPEAESAQVFPGISFTR
ncbi:hypothetical protein KGMB02707_06970 [Mesosutterella multiformis]|nr:hypothetical protein KGMB02707_06970 [Mesosutterella multiformis]